MESLESAEKRVWAASIRAAVDNRLNLLAMVPSLDDSNVSPRSLSKTREVMLLTGRSATGQNGHNGFAVRDGESPSYFFASTSKVSVDRYVILDFHL